MTTKTPSPRRAKARSSARVMYVPPDFFPTPRIATTVLREPDVSKRHKTPVFVLDATAEAQEARRELMARGLHAHGKSVGLERRRWKDWLGEADVTLTALGLTLPAKRKGRRG